MCQGTTDFDSPHARWLQHIPIWQMTILAKAQQVCIEKDGGLTAQRHLRTCLKQLIHGEKSKRSAKLLVEEHTNGLNVIALESCNLSVESIHLTHPRLLQTLSGQVNLVPTCVLSSSSLSSPLLHPPPSGILNCGPRF